MLDDARLMFCVSVEDVLVVKLVSPPKIAVMSCGPTVSRLVVQTAWPDASACALHPTMSTLSDWNSTVPVGVPAPGATGATVAVNVTGVPNADGFALEPTAVVVDAWDTTCEIPGWKVVLVSGS